MEGAKTRRIGFTGGLIDRVAVDIGVILSNPSTLRRAIMTNSVIAKL